MWFRHLEAISSVLAGVTAVVLVFSSHETSHRLAAFMVCILVGATLLVAWRPNSWSKSFASSVAVGALLVSLSQDGPPSIWVVAAFLFLYFVWISSGERPCSNDYETG